MDIITTNSLIAHDMTVQPHVNSYPPFLRQSVISHWDEIRSEHDLHNNQLMTHFLRIRIGIGLQNYSEFSPDADLGSYNILMQMLRCLYNEFFSLLSFYQNDKREI